MEKTLELCCELIRRPSVTPEDAGCQSLMMERLQALGFECVALPHGGVSNFWAQRGQHGPLLVFAGHTDVVPSGPSELWDSLPFEPTVRNGRLFGRGSADMKGSLAAMLVACEQFVAQYPNHPGRIGFLITSDEEGPAVDGTVRVLEYLAKQGQSIDWCVVGEPSSSATLGDVIKNGRRGSLGAVLTVRGVQGHIAYPHLADNPIHKILPALHELTQQQWDQGSEFFPPTTMQLSNIHAGTGATNVIPGDVQVLFNFRFSTAVTDHELRQRTESILRAHGLDFDIQWQLSGQPFLTPAGKLVAAAIDSITQITGRAPELSTAGGTSDGRFIAPTGAQVVEVGPVNATIHKLNEHVVVADLPRLAAIYQGIMERLLLEGV
ncbi:MAG: succinyl-diaminopimelate desuccinylase [Halioglobus sp.]